MFYKRPHLFSVVLFLLGGCTWTSHFILFIWDLLTLLNLSLILLISSIHPEKEWPQLGPHLTLTDPICTIMTPDHFSQTLFHLRKSIFHWPFRFIDDPIFRKGDSILPQVTPSLSNGPHLYLTDLSLFKEPPSLSNGPPSLSNGPQQTPFFPNWPHLYQTDLIFI